MNFCTNCGTKLEATWKVCPSCGELNVGLPVSNQPQPGSLDNPQVVRIQRENLDRVDRDKITSHANVLSMTSMWISIVGLLFAFFGGFGVIFSIAGVILGHTAQRNVRTAQGIESSYAKVGIVVGYIGIGIAVIVLSLTGIAVGVGLSYLDTLEY